MLPPTLSVAPEVLLPSHGSGPPLTASCCPLYPWRLSCCSAPPCCPLPLLPFGSWYCCSPPPPRALVSCPSTAVPCPQRRRRFLRFSCCLSPPCSSSSCSISRARRLVPPDGSTSLGHQKSTQPHDTASAFSNVPTMALLVLSASVHASASECVCMHAHGIVVVVLPVVVVDVHGLRLLFLL